MRINRLYFGKPRIYATTAKKTKQNTLIEQKTCKSEMTCPKKKGKLIFFSWKIYDDS